MFDARYSTRTHVCGALRPEHVGTDRQTRRLGAPSSRPRRA